MCKSTATLLNCRVLSYFYVVKKLHCRLKSCGIPVRLCTNETQLTKENIVANLTKFGFDVSAHEVFSPGPAMVKILQEKNLRPHLLVHESM